MINLQPVLENEFIRLQPLQQKINALMKQENAKSEFKLNFELEQFLKIHLHSPYDAFTPNSNIAYIYMIIAVALLILTIACFTYINLSTARSSERAKEVGIRKVLGASVYGVVALLSRDFLKLVIVAVFIASPLAWYVMNKWLQNFAYQTSITWQVFALTTLVSIAVHDAGAIICRC